MLLLSDAKRMLFTASPSKNQTVSENREEKYLRKGFSAASRPSDDIDIHDFRYLGNTPYNYQASNSASSANDQIATALRVQRDIAINVTIDQLVQPAIDLSTSYFGQNYSTSKIAQVDTLLLMGYKRLVVDLYWDPLMSDWQLCPFFMNLSSAISSSSVSPIEKSKNSSISSASTSMSITATTVRQADADLLVTKDDFVCNYHHSKFRDFLVTIDNYLYSTEQGRASQKTDIVSVIMNLHEYADADVTVNSNDTITIATAFTDTRRNNITGTTFFNLTAGTNNNVRTAISLPTRLALKKATVVPIANSHLSQIILDAVSLSSTHTSRIYTPKNLSEDRAQVQQALENSEQSTWWPDWIDLVNRRVQVIFGFGTFEPSKPATFKLTSSDNSTIFDTQSINGLMNATTSTASTCLTATSSSASNSNSSWAFINDRNQAFTYSSAFNITQCGYSPYFTHANYTDTASSIFNPDDSTHLADNILSTIWSWDVNEPAVTPAQGNNMYHNNNKRCATLVKSTGRWRAMDCNDYYRIACKKLDTPHDWLITNDTVTYDHALSPDNCPQGYIFDVPRLPRDNTALRNALDRVTTSNLGKDDKVWINLNLVYTMDDSCWVIGRYGSCWWLQNAGQKYTGLITTSVVSGLIILILVGFFIWVKCARLIRNRHSNARKAMVKKMLAKREYVTVPA